MLAEPSALMKRLEYSLPEARILDDCQGFGAVLGQNVLHLGADFGKRGVPVDSFERTVGRAAHGLGQALVGIGDLRHAVTSTADGAPWRRDARRCRAA